MSVTFYVPGAGHHTAPCPYCEQLAGAGWGTTGEGGRVPCQAYCPGTELVGNGPEVNLANRNAQIILDALGIQIANHGDLYGEIAVDDLPAIIRQTIRVINCDRPIAVEASVGAQACRIYSSGFDPGYIPRRCAEIQAVLVYAAQHSLPVVFA